jgi:hypothetical protein
MSATDRVSPSTTSNDDEDLFDFPSVELTVEGLRDASNLDASGSGATLSSVAAPLPRDVPTPHRAQAPSTVTTPPPPAFKHVAPAEPRTASVPISNPPADVPRPSRRPPLLLVGALLVLFVSNAAGFWYVWHTRTSFGAGIEDLRTELDDASKRLERARREVAAQAGTAVLTDEQIELERVSALERSSVAMAENEIFAGEYGAARRRLNKLLAQADRMSASLRAEIEPRATFLLAKSYLDEAHARQGGKR